MSGATSGVKLDNTVVDKFNEFKLKKTISYLIFGFSDDISKIVVLHEGPPKVNEKAPTAEKNQYWAEMISKLPENDVRYVAIDVFYDINDGPRNDIYFIAWAPDTATIKRKMLCASSKDALKNALHGIRVNMQATCKSDLDFESILSEKMKSK